jgi:hypothetical protein
VIVCGDFEYEWRGDECTAVNNAVGGHYVTGRLPTGVTFDNRTHVLVREANYHSNIIMLFQSIYKVNIQ